MNNDLRYYGNPMNWESTKGDLISREALKKAVEEAFEKADLSEYEACVCVCEIYDKQIDNAPTVYPICEDKVCKYRANEKPQGEWEKIGEIGLAYKCNKCGEFNVIPTNFCPNCGADMKGGAE